MAPVKHFARLRQQQYVGIGRRWVVVCRPCGWVSPKRQDKADANEDFRRHQEGR